jgi:hypothetical protein
MPPIKQPTKNRIDNKQNQPIKQTTIIGTNQSSNSPNQVTKQSKKTRISLTNQKRN